MPRKKSNLNNACSREARRKRVKRAHESEEQIAARNAAQRIRTAEIRSQEYLENSVMNFREKIYRELEGCENEKFEERPLASGQRGEDSKKRS